jgi:hypothetical protein
VLAAAAAVAAGWRASRAGSVAGPVLVDGAHGVDRFNNGSHETRKDGTVIWPKKYVGISAAMDWSAYDFLELTLYNPGERAIAFSFEVKDAGSNDYWTRVNLPQILGPGLQTIRLPTRLRVGETGRPGRPLDSAKVVSLILARDDADDATPVEVRRIELKKAAKADAPGILAFHAGPEDAGVPDGFESLNEHTEYDRRRKWGWLAHDFWAPYAQANRVIAPDRLTSSNLLIASAKLRLDLKPGNYRVWMIIDHPGGFWGEYPYYHRRTVRAQGRLALDERMTPEQARADYFRWQDAQDREDDDLFDRYWSKILKEKTFDARVTDGHLDLAFQNEDCPDQIPCFGLALSALVVYPIDTPEQKARGQAWLARLREDRRAEYRSQHRLAAPALTTLLAGLPSGLGVWNASPDLDLSLAHPSDLLSLVERAHAAPRVTVFGNARGYFAPAVSWKGAVANAVAWKVDGVPAGVTLTGGWIGYRALRSSYNGNLYSVRERWVTDAVRHSFAREELGRLWLSFAAAKGARAGVYPVSLVLSSADGRAVRVPFELRVFKAQAADLDFPVGPFNDGIVEDWWEPSVLRPRLARLERLSLQRMRALGATAFSFTPAMTVSVKDGKLEVDTQEVDRVMAEARSLGFQGLVGYGDVFHGENLCAPAADDSPLSGALRFQEAADLLEARAKAHHWLPLALIVCDEPVGAAVDDAAHRLRLLPKIDAGRLVQWSVTTSLGAHATAAGRTLVSQVSLPFLSEFSAGDIRFPWAFYNDTSRKTVGLGLYRLRKTTDLKYRLMWNWNQNLGDPYFDFDSRESDYAWCSSTADERLRCTVEMDRVVDRGLTDYRVALGLERFLAARKDLTAEQRARGERLLDEARSNGVDADAWLAKAADYQEGF